MAKQQQQRKAASLALLLLLAVASLSALSGASAHPWRTRAYQQQQQQQAQEQQQFQANSANGNNENAAASSSSSSSATSDVDAAAAASASSHSHVPASGLGSQPPMQQPPPPLHEHVAAAAAASNRAAPRTAGSSSVEVNSAAAGDEQTLTTSAPETTKTTATATATTKAAEEEPSTSPGPPKPPLLPPPPRPPTPPERRALRDRDRRAAFVAAHTPMDPEWRRLVRRGFVPASEFRRGGRGRGSRGGNLGADAPELLETVPAVEAILHLDGQFAAPETMTVAQRDSAVAAAVADVLGVKRSDVAVAEAVPDGSDYKKPPAPAPGPSAPAVVKEEKAARRRLAQAGTATTTSQQQQQPKPSAPAPAAPAPKPAAPAPAAPAPAAPAPAAPAPAASAVPKPAASAPAPAVAAAAPAAATAAAPAAAAAAAASKPVAAPAPSPAPPLRDVIVRVDGQKPGTGEALAKKLAAAASDGTLAQALRARGFASTSEGGAAADALGASIASDPTEPTWKDKLPFPFWLFVVVVACGGLLVLLAVAALLFCCFRNGFCCCCFGSPEKRKARKEQQEERKRLRLEAAAAKKDAKAGAAKKRKKGADVAAVDDSDVEKGGGVAAGSVGRRSVAPAPGANDKDAPADVSSTIQLLRDYAGELQNGGGEKDVAAAAGAIVAAGTAAAAISGGGAVADARALAAERRSHLPPAPKLCDDDEEEIVPSTPRGAPSTRATAAAAAAAVAAGAGGSATAADANGDNNNNKNDDDDDEAASVLASPRSLALPSRELTARLDAANARLAAYVGSLTVKTAAPVVASLLASLRARAAAASAPPPGSTDEAALHAAARALVDAGCYGLSVSADPARKSKKNGAVVNLPRFTIEAARVATATTVAAVGRVASPADSANVPRRSSRSSSNNNNNNNPSALIVGNGAPVDVTLFVDGSEFESAKSFSAVARDAEFVPTVLELEPPGMLVPGAIANNRNENNNASVASSVAPALAGIVTERGRYSLGEWLSKHRLNNALSSPSSLAAGVSCPVVPAQAARVALVHALEALTYLHSRGVCHRDVTPDTLRWHDAGRRWRLALPRASRWARAGSPSAPLSYSLRYAAPEVVAADALAAGRRLAEANAAAADSTNVVVAVENGNGDDEAAAKKTNASRGFGSGLAIAEHPATFTADPASDVWAVGLLAWEAFSGRPLFGEAAGDGSSAATMSDEQVAAALLGFRKLPFEADPSLWVNFADGGAAELVKAMLSRAPDARPTAVAALRAATKLAAEASRH